MPCRDDYPVREITGRTVDPNPELKARLDLATRLLCSLLTEVSHMSTVKAYIARTPELSRWWELHQKDDQKRLAIEKLEAAAAALGMKVVQA